MALTLDDIMSDVTLARTVKAPRCAIFFFASVTMYVWEGVGDLVAGGNTFKGLGDLASIDGAIQFGPGLQTQPLTLKLNVKAPMLAAALTNQAAECKGRFCQLGFIPLGQFDDAGVPVPGKEWQAAAEPFIGGTYVMDGLATEYDRETGVGQALMTLLPQTADKHFAPAGTLSDTDQQTRYPGDTSLQRMALYRIGMTIL